MDSGMMGPDWFWRWMAYLAGIGAAALLAATGYGLYWLVQHVRFK